MNKSANIFLNAMFKLLEHCKTENWPTWPAVWMGMRRRARKEVRILLEWMKKHELFVTVVSSVIGALLGLMARDLIKGL